jgi:hypothetical protein
VTYTGNNFQEGISLTFIDEVIKMKKFTYGACEMCFNPIKYWFKKGLFNQLLIRFLSNTNIRWYQKFNICVYLSTYFAMAASFYYVILEGICSILYPQLYDKFMVRSFDVMLTCVIIFGATNVVGEIVLQWRLYSITGKTFISILWNELKWIPALALYFNSILFHITEASVMYFWGIKTEWGSTEKNITKLDSIDALKVTLKIYWKEYVFMLLLLLPYLFCVIWFHMSFYQSWSILSYTIAHMLGPILLNPYIMCFSY